MTATDGPDETPAWVEDVIEFWFVETPRTSWFKATPEFDRCIRARFGQLHAEVAAGPGTTNVLSARHALATVIVLDQFSRNMFRGMPRAFATDTAARRVANAAIERGLDRELTSDGRAFLYLPFEHSESLADQERSVALFAHLGDPDYSGYAIAHRDIIARFGRFPHRNAILGRISTPKEVAFLAEPGSSF